MKWLVACLIALCMVATAMAGGDPYIGVVGNDINANPFYLSPKYQQWLHDQTYWEVPTEGEAFSATTPVDQPEICDTTGAGGPPNFTTRGNPNALVSVANGGTFTWVVNFPQKPVGQISLAIRCGILKPNAFASFGFNAIARSAGEALATIEALASPGPFNDHFTPFHLTAYKNPSQYQFTLDANLAMLDSGSITVLNGSPDTKISLKACMDKTIVAKLPFGGQVNALGETEFALKAGDHIQVIMNIPSDNLVDIYCHSESLKVMGIKESPF